MPAINDLSSHARIRFMRVGSILSGADDDSQQSVDLAQYGGGAIIAVNVAAIATAATEFVIIDSDDDSTYAETEYSYTLAPGTINSVLPMFVHPNVCRRYVKVRMKFGGGSLTGGGTHAFQVGRVNGAINTEPAPFVINTGTGA